MLILPCYVDNSTLPIIPNKFHDTLEVSLQRLCALVCIGEMLVKKSKLNSHTNIERVGVRSSLGRESKTKNSSFFSNRYNSERQPLL